MMHDPSHPGDIIKVDCLEALQLTVTAAAQGLGVSRKALSELINGKSGISPEMAIRLEKAGWSTAEVWLTMQMNYDLWQARQNEKNLEVKKFSEVIHA
jgi:antitoxin HigA-1